MTSALPSVLEAILNPEFKKSGKIRQCQAPARYEIRQYITLNLLRDIPFWFTFCLDNTNQGLGVQGL